MTLKESLNGIIRDDHIIQGPDYTDLKIEGIHIAAIVVLFILALIGIRVALGSSSPTAKAVVAIIISMIILAFVLLAMYMGMIQ